MTRRNRSKPNYDNVGKAYIGSSLSEDLNYWGSMSQRGQDRMRDDHARAGLPIERRREILWQGPPDSGLLSREYALIAHRTNIPDCGYNLMTMLSGVNVTKFNWDRPGGPIQSTVHCPYGQYTIHIRGELPLWTRFADLDGNGIEIYRDPHKTKVWNEYLAHKDKMLKLLGPGPG